MPPIVPRRWQNDVPFVGRTTELGMLGNIVALSAEGRSAVIAVTGEAGIGKSRLVHEVIAPFVADHPGCLLRRGHVCAVRRVERVVARRQRVARPRRPRPQCDPRRGAPTRRTTVERVRRARSRHARVRAARRGGAPPARPSVRRSMRSARPPPVTPCSRRWRGCCGVGRRCRRWCSGSMTCSGRRRCCAS